MLAGIEPMRIGTLRARGAPRDDIAFRQALSGLLDRADLQPAGLPPSAVLIVRRLTESLSGIGAVRGTAGRYWERVVRARLEDLYRRAARPASGPIPVDCEAVVFMSRAELLACLVRDLVRGLARRRWWWQAVLSRWPAGAAPATAAAALLAEEPRQLPAAIALLHATGDATRVLDAIATEEVVALVRALAAEFGLRHVDAAVSRRHSELAVGEDQASPAGMRSPRELRGAHGDGLSPSVDPREPPADFDESPRSPVLDPLFAVVSRTPLTRDRRLLLGMALALAQRPWAARTESFQREAMRHWWHAMGAPGTDEPPVRTVDQQWAAGSVAGVSNAVAADTPAAVIADRKLPIDAPVGPLPDAGRTPPMPTAAVLSDRRVADAPAAAQVSASHRVAATTDALRPAPAWAAPAIAPAEASAPGSALADPVTTEFGGVLYLLNLMTALDLPDCFEPDWRLASRLGPWALLATLGRALLEAAAIDANTDPIWPWLAALDGRPPGEPTGHELTVPPAFRLPHAWIADGVPGDTYYMAQARGRLRLWSEGVLLAEVPRDAPSPERQAAAELDRLLPGADRPVLRRARWRTAPLARLRLATAGPALRRFVSYVLPFLQHRLALALGEPAAGPGTIAALLRGRARLYASPTHIDLVAPLDAISLPARLAGLDRDPGWQPSLGRVVSFHFE